MKYLILGSEGFIGRALLNYFVNERGSSVFTVDRKGCNPFKNQTHQIIDFSNGASNIPFGEFDYIINASGSANVQASFVEEEMDRAANLMNVQMMLEQMVQQGSRAKFINISSAAVYGVPTKLPISEAHSIGATPISPYGKHKQMSEQLLMSYAQDYGLKTHSLRVFSCYGPNQKKLLLWDIFRKIKVDRRDKLELFGTGDESRDYIYIDDLVLAFKTVLLKSNFDGSPINIASGIETRISWAASKAIEILQPNTELCFNKKTRKGDPLNWNADVQKLHALGFHPKYTFEEGLQEYYKWVLSLDE
jgi:UDP-glucose 4-epimerase